MSATVESGPAPFQRARVVLFGPVCPPTIFTYQLDTAEVERRERQQMAPLLARDVLEVLHKLPLGEAVPRSRLTDIDKRALKRAPAGAVVREGRWVTRLAAPPLRVRFALVEARDVGAGLVEVNRYARFCPRGLLLPGEPTDPVARAELHVQATYWGFGAYVPGKRPGQLRTLVDHRGYRAPHRGAGHWQLCEYVFAHAHPDNNPLPHGLAGGTGGTTPGSVTPPGSTFIPGEGDRYR
ncbi:hypothetical protein [Pseudonocardia spinosispora]|uniref:hypothetical protein n=1 Tax=Pseudonocardia spinosispora TaxID=103441 RepID=UPI0004275C4B|nr:hypothetical protein [Pseudonocardia spinosispora]